MFFGLTPEQEMIVETVRSFVEAEIYPLEDEVERTGHAAPGDGPRDCAQGAGYGLLRPKLP